MALPSPDSSAGPGRFDPVAADRAIPEIDWTVLPPGTTRCRSDAPSGALATVALGPADGRRVLLVPGATGSKEDFVLMMPALAAAGYRVESFDMAGQYESARAGPENLQPPQRRYRLSLFVDDLLAMITAGRTPVHLLGYSFAGTVCAAVVAARPDLVASLTLLSAPPLSGQVFRGMRIIGPATWLAGGRTAASVMLWGIRSNLNRVGPARLRFVTDRLRVTRRSSVDDMIGLMLRTPDLDADLRAAGIPLLVAVGTSDLWSQRRHRRYADRIGARFVGYSTGHSPCETAPHQVVADLLQLFRRAEAGG